MNATVILDQGGNVTFTNLDEISGKVVVRCAKAADISSIIVKLEGESRTRLLSPQGLNGERPKAQLEYHKILYKVQMVFPPSDVLEGRSWTPKICYTLPLGQHEYRFKFKIPFNNSCANDRSQLPTMSMSGTGFEVARPQTGHVRKTLPPTLSGFPGEAEVRYYVKATVARHSFFKENPRAYAPFNFFPIEPPRPADTGSEVYARQKHTFNAILEGEPVKSKMKGILGTKKEPIASAEDAPLVSVDARLPEPAILTCNQEIHLRIIVKKLNSYSGIVYLQSLQIALVAHTKIRAHEVHRIESNSWIVMSKSNMGIPIGLPTDQVNTETVIDDRMWKGQPLPNTVAPSFETCNISRSYKLDVRVGLSYVGNMQTASKPQAVALPLSLDCQVFSGIAPPAELLEAMAQAKANIHRSPTAKTDLAADNLRIEGRLPSDFGVNRVSPTPIEAAGRSGAPEMPARPGAATEQEDTMHNDAPPSYEDAVASNLRPVDAPRPDYAPPRPGEDDVLSRDEKKGWVD